MESKEKNSVFNKGRMINNVMYLLKLKNRRIGELEEYAGLSAGYIARSRKSSNTTKPGIEYIMRMADFLGVTIDALLKADLTKLSAADQYWMEFTKKVTDATRKDKVAWIAPNDTLLKLNMQDGNILQIKLKEVPVKTPKPSFIDAVMVRELWLQGSKAATAKRLCTSENIQLAGAVNELYVEAAKNASRPKIDKATKNMLDEFLIMLEGMR